MERFKIGAYDVELRNGFLDFYLHGKFVAGMLPINTEELLDALKLHEEEIRQAAHHMHETFRETGEKQREIEEYIDQNVVKTRAKIWTDVQKYGFSAVGVVGDQGNPHFTYTVGLYPGMPEFLMFGVRPDGATVLFHQIVKKQKDEGVIFESGKTYEGISERYPLYFHQVDRYKYKDYVLAAIRWHNNSREFPLYQVVWPDTAGRFPWQTGFEQRFVKDQPLLFSYQ